MRGGIYSLHLFLYSQENVFEGLQLLTWRYHLLLQCRSVAPVIKSAIHSGVKIVEEKKTVCFQSIWLKLDCEGEQFKDSLVLASRRRFFCVG